MANLIVGSIVAIMLIAAVRYIYKKKKAGVKCIGCPAGENNCCSGNKGGCGCGCDDDK